MKLLRLSLFFLSGIVACVMFSSVCFASEDFENSNSALSRTSSRASGLWLYSGYVQFERFSSDTKRTIIPTPTDGGIREDIPAKYKDRFDRWKAELLSTDFGRQQWDKYAYNKEFVLTIAIRGDRERGAGTDKLLWNEGGDLVGATITLGADIEKGYPSPIYYPVLNSLSTDSTTYSINARILAATKISHEIGHVNQASVENTNKLQTQNRLMPVYTSIFLKNGLNIKDKKLTDLAMQMGGTPTEIWESREYWSEVNAMGYLKERISKEDYYCYVFNRIKLNLDTYAKDYEHRFDPVSALSGAPCKR